MFLCKSIKDVYSCTNYYQYSVIKTNAYNLYHFSGLNMFVSEQLPRRTIPHRTVFGPNEWFYSAIVVLVGVVVMCDSHRDCGPGGR